MNKFVEFYNYVAGDAEAKSKLEALMAKGANMDKDAYFDEMIAFAKDQGYDFTKEEVIKYFEDNFAEGELSDDDLEAVAGGKSSFGADFWKGFKAGFVSVATSLGFCFLAD
ncbi:MAG: Nif11-like leader peptide family RiPP precursor [Bacillota bacterium]